MSDGQQEEQLKPLNIYQRLNAIKREVGYVQKDKKVESYMAVTHDAVTALTRQHFIDNGVLPVIEELSSVLADTGTVTSRNTPLVRFEAKYCVSFVNVDEPEQLVKVSLTAHAIDHGDKAPGKAHSYAMKYAVLKVLNLESGEDDEGREQRAKPKEQALKPGVGVHKPTDGAGDSLTNIQKEKVDRIRSTVIDCFEAGVPEEAYRAIDTANLDVDEKVYLWDNLDSKIRSALKKIGQTKTVTPLHA